MRKNAARRLGLDCCCAGLLSSHECFSNMSGKRTQTRLFFRLIVPKLQRLHLRSVGSMGFATKIELCDD